MRSLATQAGRGSVFTAGALISFLSLGFLVSWVYFSGLGLGCDSEEQDVYGEFPQFGDRRIEPQANEETGDCSARYESRKNRRDIQDYYARNLEANGWKVTRKPSPGQLAPPEKTAMEEPVPGNPEKTRKVPVADAEELISAERGEYFYQVEYYSLQDYIESRPGLEVIVHVGKQ
ncbi:hypothetical protein BH24ACT22_BH24ACT22_06690 [soil metagenome]